MIFKHISICVSKIEYITLPYTCSILYLFFNLTVISSICDILCDSGKDMWTTPKQMA